MMQPSAVPQQLHQRIILDTQWLVDNFISETGSMALMDYDLDEVLSNAFNAIAMVTEIEYRINGFTQMYLRWGDGKDTGGVPDGQILATAFQNLVRGLLNMYKRVGMWDHTGFCPYYYVDREYRDCILSRYED